MAETRPAATVLLLRDAGGRAEIFLVQRNRSVGFFPNAWVFPGGRVDAKDVLTGHPAVEGGARYAALAGPQGIATLVASVRETFEETGLWLGRGDPGPEARGKLLRNEVDFPSLLSAGGTPAPTIELDRLAPWSWWVTPEVEPKRYDTRFLVAVAPEGVGVHDDGETVNSGWFDPAEAVAKAERGELPTAPPTWHTLSELAQLGTVDAILDAAWKRPHRPIQPIARFPDGQFELILPGHPEHPEPAFPGLPTCVRFVQGRWWAA